MRQADAIAQRSQLPRTWVRHTIGQARLQASVIKASTPAPAGTPKDWGAYRARFVEPVRIAAGLEFWRSNRAALERAEHDTGVPAAIIVGILGVESIYGRQMGNYRVLDALCTLAFDFPPSHPRAAARAAYFASELEAFLQLVHQRHLDPLRLRGSYAGAMGMPQFMPSNWSKYGVDASGDGQLDLYGNAADAIASVANYFQAFGWQAGEPTHFAARLTAQGAQRAELLAPDIVPSFDATTLLAKGVELEEAARHYPGTLALVELQNGSAEPLYLATTSNFYTITRYNWSAYYALAVLELGASVQAAEAAQAAPQAVPESAH